MYSFDKSWHTHEQKLSLLMYSFFTIPGIHMSKSCLSWCTVFLQFLAYTWARVLFLDVQIRDNFWRTHDHELSNLIQWSCEIYLPLAVDMSCLSWWTAVVINDWSRVILVVCRKSTNSVSGKIRKRKLRYENSTNYRCRTSEYLEIFNAIFNFLPYHVLSRRLWGALFIYSINDC